LCKSSDCGAGDYQHLNQLNKVFTLGGDHKISAFKQHNKTVHAIPSAGKLGASAQQKEVNKRSFVKFAMGAAALIQSADARYKRENPQGEGSGEGGEGVLTGASSEPQVLNLHSTPYNKVVMWLKSRFAEVELTTGMMLSASIGSGPRCVPLLNVEMSEAIVQGLDIYEASVSYSPRVVVIPGQAMDAWLDIRSPNGFISEMDDNLFEKVFQSRQISQSICLKGLSPLPFMDITLSTTSYVQDDKLMYALIVITQGHAFVLSPREEDTNFGPIMSEITQGTIRIFNKLGLKVSAVENVMCPTLDVSTHDNSPGVAHLARIAVENTHALDSLDGIHRVFNAGMKGGNTIYANQRDSFNNWVDEEIGAWDKKTSKGPRSSVIKTKKQKFSPVVSWGRYQERAVVKTRYMVRSFHEGHFKHLEDNEE